MALLSTGLAAVPNPRGTAPVTRRTAVFAGSVACGCSCCSPEPASALASLTRPPEDDLRTYDVPRDARRDAGFACGMATGMKDYERAVSGRKRELFDRLLTSLPKSDAVVVELGMGSFPNAEYLAAMPSQGAAPQRMDLIGLDPNDSMEAYARRSAAKAGLLEQGHSLRVTHGVGEVLPLADRSADAVICTLTLCSVASPERVLAEVRRVLRPGGKLLFLEHVLSETDAALAAQQRAATPMQVEFADGCHLDRRTGRLVEEAGFASVDAKYTELTGFYFLNPTASGIATR